MPTSTDKIFSLEDVQSVLADFFASELSQAKQQGSGVTQYVGARYVPLFADPIEWDSARAYEPLTIVLHKGNSYTSRQSVPTGVDISDDAYWALTGNYNAQIEQYRAEVQTFDRRIADNATNIADEKERAIAAESTKAPTSHASSEQIHGIGTATLYGHVKLADNIDAIPQEASTGIGASPKLVADKLDSYYTKEQADSKFEPLHSDEPDYILGCVGDSILAGWSKEHTTGIDAWDTYLGKALKFKPENVYKAAIGGAGYVSGTTFESELRQLKNTIVDAGKSLNDVSMIVIGGGINDNTNDKTRDAVLSAATSAVNTACELFPNAQVHIFPMIMGWKGLRSHLLILEDAIVEGAMLCSEGNRHQVITHTGCWSWCYDGIDEGVSSDGVHLLQKGQQRVGTSMAVEINGGSAYRSGYTFDISNAQGNKVATGHRRDSMVFFKLATNITTIKVGDKNAALGMPSRYCSESMCITFSKPDESNTVIMFSEIEKGYFNSYTALSNAGCYGSVAYQIDYRSNIS